MKAERINKSENMNTDLIYMREKLKSLDNAVDYILRNYEHELETDKYKREDYLKKHLLVFIEVSIKLERSLNKLIGD